MTRTRVGQLTQQFMARWPQFSYGNVVATNLVAVKTRPEIKDAFDRAGIEIPFPHGTLYTGSVTEPFPARMVGSEPGAAPEWSG